MLRNYLSAALRNLFRNGAYAAINICGLALGFAATLLIALFVRDEYSYDRFVPHYERVYRLLEIIQIPGHAPLRIAVTSSDIAGALQLDFPQVEMTTRLAATQAALRRGDIELTSFIHWADPDFFRLFPMQSVAGNLETALSMPDGLVLTRSAARRFFGRDDVVGESIELDRQHVMRVAAVIEDLPSSSHLKVDVFGPGIASFSELSILDAAGTDPATIKRENVYTYIRLRPEARIEDLIAAMPDFLARHLGGEIGGVPRAQAYQYRFVPLAGIHLERPSIGDMKPPSDPRTLHAMIGIAALILFVAASNFVSMMTARAARRAVEVGVRKVVGASRRQIIVQFLGECLFYAWLALVVALLLVSIALPGFNAFLQRGIAVDLLQSPMLAVAITCTWLIVGLAAGAYPALVLSMFKPSMVLKGAVAMPGGSGRMRQALVIFQFGTLIALIVATLTIHRQTEYALEDRLRLQRDQIYFGRSGCPEPFRQAAEGLPGVRAVTCASGTALAMDRWDTTFSLPEGREVSFRVAQVEHGFFELFDLEPLAGRLFAPNRGQDNVLRGNAASDTNPSIIINETGARALGFTSSAAAVGQARRWVRTARVGSEFTRLPSSSSQIIGVVPDFSVGSVRDAIEPTVYYIDPSMVFMTVLKLDGGSVAESMRSVRELWARQGESRPFEGVFLSQYTNDLYADILRQATIFSLFSGVAITIAALGLLGLAVFTAERRTREIGLRKVMGASRRDILWFLGWQFTRPVLWANVIAWPVAYFLMQRWLEGFAYHVDLNPLAFLAASLLALVIALATICGHALVVARAKPAEALRYE